MIDERTIKLMRYALDPSAGDGESANAWELARAQIRRQGVRLDDLLQAAPPADAGVQIVVNDGAPVEFDMVMPWGKHKGKTLRDIYLNAPGYLDWVMDKCDAASPSLKRAVEVVMSGGKRG